MTGSIETRVCLYQQYVGMSGTYASDTPGTGPTKAQQVDLPDLATAHRSTHGINPPRGPPTPHLRGSTPLLLLLELSREYPSPPKPSGVLPTTSIFTTCFPSCFPFHYPTAEPDKLSRPLSRITLEIARVQLDISTTHAPIRYRYHGPAEGVGPVFSRTSSFTLRLLQDSEILGAKSKYLETPLYPN